MLKNLAVISCCMALASPLAVLGAEQTAPDPLAEGLGLRQRLDLLVERVKLEQGRVETMSADFVQDKVSHVLVEPETSTGTFHYRAPDRVRWEYDEPIPIVMTISGEEMLTFYEDLGRAERVAIGSYSEQVFKYLGASGSLETLMKYFSLTAEFPEQTGQPFHLELLPRYSRIKKRIRSMEIWIDAQTYLPSRVKYVEPSGDLTEYRFENVTANEGLPEGLFEVVLPPGTEVRAVDFKSGR